MPRTIVFWFDFMSPYAYLASTQIDALAARHGCTVEPRAVELAELKRLAGNTGPSTRHIPLKLRYARTDMQRWARHYGVPLVMPAGSDPVRPDRGAILAARQGKIAAYARSVWTQAWVEGADLGTDALLERAAREAGMDAAELRRFADGEEGKAALAEQTRQASAEGIFGVPSFVVDGEMWWGNDRLDFLEAHLAGR